MLKKWQIVDVLHLVFFLMRDHGPREILWSKIVVGKVPVAQFSVVFPG